MRKLKTLGSALVVALVLVTCADYVSFAATGKSLILGRANYATKITSLSRSTSGAALKLHTASTSNAPFTTNAKGKVANLNADRLDGLDSSALVNKALVFTTSVNVPSATSITVTLPNVPAGKYLFNSDGFIYTTMTNGHGCYLYVPSTSQYIYEWFPAEADNFFMPNGSGFVKVPTSQDLTYRCYDNGGATANWVSLAAQPLQVILTPVSQVGSSAPTAARMTGTGARTHATVG